MNLLIGSFLIRIENVKVNELKNVCRNSRSYVTFRWFKSVVAADSSTALDDVIRGWPRTGYEKQRNEVKSNRINKTQEKKKKPKSGKAELRWTLREPKGEIKNMP